MAPHGTCNEAIALRSEVDDLKSDVSELKSEASSVTEIKGKIEPMSQAIEELKSGRAEDQKLLTQIQIEQTSQGTKLDHVSTLLTKHVDKAGDAFKTYGLPILLIVAATLANIAASYAVAKP